MKDTGLLPEKRVLMLGIVLFFLSLCIPSCYQKLGLFIWVTIVLYLFLSLLGGTQTLICASSHIKERVQSGLLTCPHSLKPSEKSFPPRCLKSSFVYTRRSTGSAHEAEFWHIWCSRSLWHQEFFWTSSSTARIPSPSPTLLGSQKELLEKLPWKIKFHLVFPATSRLYSQFDFNSLWVRSIDVPGDLKPLPTVEGGTLH